MTKLLIRMGRASWCALVAVCAVACREAPPVPSPPSAAPAPTSSPAAQPTSSSSPAGSGAAGAPRRTFGFDADRIDAPPRAFTFARTGGGREGKWMVRAEPDARSGPNVLAQVDADTTNARFPLAIADAPAVRDLRLSVLCKMLSGKVDQACGLVLRYQDANNYYVTRANVLENNVRLYTVSDGKRRQIASADVPVAKSAWHSYRIEAQGDRFRVFWNDKQLIEHRDSTFSQPGGVGLWTKADSVTLFDDLTVEPL